MPYAPPAPPDFGPALQNYLAKQEVTRLLQSAEQAEQVAAADAGVTAAGTELAAGGGVAELAGGTATVAALPAAATVGFVAVSSYTLAQGIRQIPGWDNAWKHFGSDLLDGLAGLTGHGGVSSEVKLYVADYVQHRFIVQRQREATMNQMWAAMHVQSMRRLNVIANDLARVNKAAHNADKAVLHNAHVYADLQRAAAIRYADARAHGVGVAAEAYARKLAVANQTYAHSIAAQAERNANRHTTGAINGLRHDLEGFTAGAVAVGVATHLKPITEALAALKAQVGKLQTENDECTQPMCEMVGPKSDWGKLLKRFAPKAIFALLALLAAEHPDEVAKAAAELGSALGPVLEVAISSALIPLGSAPVHQPSEASGALGHLPLGL